MDQHEVPAADTAYWKGYWNRLSGRLESDGRRTILPDWRTWSLPVLLPVRPAWISVAAAVLLVATGIFIGQSLYVGRSADGAYARASVFDPAVVAEFNSLASTYLERSKVILIGLDNFDPRNDDLSTMNFSRQQRFSQELLRQGRELKSHQVMAADPSMHLLVEEIERVLLQLANSEGEDYRWTISLVQEGIDKNSILLKITLVELGQSHDAVEEDDSSTKVKVSSFLT
jgi:hypothetical protein